MPIHKIPLKFQGERMKHRIAHTKSRIDNMESSHKVFLNSLVTSLDAVLEVARWAVLIGKDVEIKGMKFANKYEEWAGSVDDGYDMIINKKTVNIKRNKRSFSSIEDFISNFKKFERPILVSATHVNTPDITLILSSDLRGGIIIDKKHKDHWGIRKGVFDTRYDTMQNCYDVSSDYVTWLALK